MGGNAGIGVILWQHCEDPVGEGLLLARPLCRGIAGKAPAHAGEGFAGV